MSSPGRLTEAEAAKVLAGARSIPLQHGASSVVVRPLGGTDLEGVVHAIDLTSGAQRTLVLFLSSSCEGCSELFDAAADPSGFGLEPDDRVLIIAHSSDDAVALDARSTGALLLVSDEAFSDFRVTGPPFFSLVEPTCPTVVTEGVAWGIEPIAAAVRAALAGSPIVESVRLERDSGR